MSDPYRGVASTVATPDSFRTSRPATPVGPRGRAVVNREAFAAWCDLGVAYGACSVGLRRPQDAATSVSSGNSLREHRFAPLAEARRCRVLRRPLNAVIEAF